MLTLSHLPHSCTGTPVNLEVMEIQISTLVASVSS